MLKMILESLTMVNRRGITYDEDNLDEAMCKEELVANEVLVHKPVTSVDKFKKKKCCLYPIKIFFFNLHHKDPLLKESRIFTFFILASLMEIKKIVLDKVRLLHSRAITQNHQSKHNYKKIMAQIQSLDRDFQSPAEIRAIKFVGAKIYETLAKHVSDTLVNEIRTFDDLTKYKEFINGIDYDIMHDRLKSASLVANDEGNLALSEDDIEILEINSTHDYQVSPYTKKFNYGESTGLKTVNQTSVSSTNLDTSIKRIMESVEYPKNSTSKPVKRKEYKPGYRTGGYAILKALYQENGISKHRIAHLAQPYTDSEFNFAMRNSAWSSITTLKSKNLVYKETGSKKYYLTEKGHCLAKEMFKDSSFVQNDDEIKLVIDSREVRNRKCRMYFQEYFMACDVPFDTRSLEVGDFIWVRGDWVCGTIVERKKGSDFASSISDGRYKDQKKRLLGTRIPNVFYIVEGLKKSDLLKVGYEHGMYSLTTIKMENIIVLETSDIKSTAQVLKKIDDSIRSLSWEIDNPVSYGSFIEKGSKNEDIDCNMMLYYTFSAISGISHRKALFLSDHFGTLKSFYEVYESGHGKEYLSKLIFEGKPLPKKNICDIMDIMLVV